MFFSGVQIDYSRWQQTLMTVLSLDIEYQDGVDHDSRLHLLIQARLGYRNKGKCRPHWSATVMTPLRNIVSWMLSKDL